MCAPLSQFKVIPHERHKACAGRQQLGLSGSSVETTVLETHDSD